ncbi:MAG TPA: hypothetical protein VGM18_07235 [Candidatus Sulfotelmatobacter sp.]
MLGLVPWLLPGGFRRPAPGALTWLGIVVCFGKGDLLPLRLGICGSRTRHPAPIVSTKFLVTTALEKSALNCAVEKRFQLCAPPMDVLAPVMRRSSSAAS